jgi:hypothetical protein
MKPNGRLLSPEEMKKSIEGWQPQYLNPLTLLVMRAQDVKTAEKVASEIFAELETIFVWSKYPKKGKAYQKYQDLRARFVPPSVVKEEKQ